MSGIALRVALVAAAVIAAVADPQRRPRRPARGADRRRADDRVHVHHRAHPLRPPHLRRRRQRRGGAPGRDQRQPDQAQRLHPRLDARRGRRDPGRLAAAGGQPAVGLRRRAAARDRRPGDRRHQPVRRSRLRLVGAARRGRDRLDLQRHGPAGARLRRQVHDHRRRPARRGDDRRGDPAPPRAGAADLAGADRQSASRSASRTSASTATPPLLAELGRAAEARRLGRVLRLGPPRLPRARDAGRGPVGRGRGASRRPPSGSGSA